MILFECRKMVQRIFSWEYTMKMDEMKSWSSFDSQTWLKFREWAMQQNKLALFPFIDHKGTRSSIHLYLERLKRNVNSDCWALIFPMLLSTWKLKIPRNIKSLSYVKISCIFYIIDRLHFICSLIYTKKNSFT